MSTSAIGTVTDALVDAWQNLGDLVGVNVFSGPVSMDEAGLECIALGTASLSERPAAMGGVREETWDVDGEIRIAPSTWQGTTEATIRHIRDRATSVFAALETHVNDTYPGTLPDVSITAGQLTPELSADGRACWLSFTLQITTLKTP